MDTWALLLDLLILLTGAMLMGSLFERLGQSALMGYLLAGALVGPGGFHIITREDMVHEMAELGVALLLFTIGLEFSWKKLKSLGAVALIGGGAQVVVTAALTTGVAMALGMAPRVAITVGVVIAPSSTAVVLRLLRDRAEMDSQHGRASLGILLFQDLAVIPLVLLVTSLGGEGSAGETLWSVVRTAGLASILVAVLLVVGGWLLPLLLAALPTSRNRDLAILVAIATCLGATWGSHALGLSPALGAFLAGMFLAESPFAAQIRADVAPLRTLFMTLFFASIGMVAQLTWALTHLHWALLFTVVIMIVKAAVIWVTLRALGKLNRHALTTGLVLSQMGEFSFLLAQTALKIDLLSDDVFQMLASVTVLSLLLTPSLIGRAMGVATRVEGMLSRVTKRAPKPDTDVPSKSHATDHALVVGFGPAGRMVHLALDGAGVKTIVVDLNPKTVINARRLGLSAESGDATRPEILEHLGVAEARLMVITLPDLRPTLDIIAHARTLAPNLPIVARARHHIHTIHLLASGAEMVVDEEMGVGEKMGQEALELIRGEGVETPSAQ